MHFRFSSFLFFLSGGAFYSSLNVLSLGGNLLSEVPETVGNLSQLQALTLCDNLIEILPASIARLTNLRSLLLHKNRLRHLPRDIITLKNLVEVSNRREWKLNRIQQQHSERFSLTHDVLLFCFSSRCEKILWLCVSFRKYHCIHRHCWNWPLVSFVHRAYRLNRMSCRNRCTTT